MKLVFCKKLAACLCMKHSTSPLPEPPQIYRRRSSIPIGDRHSNGPRYNNATTPDAAPTRNEAADKALQNILDLLQTLMKTLTARVHDEEEQRKEAEKENDIINDWMLAAAVVDRIFAIIFTILFIGLTVAFIAIIAIHGRA